MTITLQSASAAVRRTLADIVATLPEGTDVSIEDRFHPAPPTHSEPHVHSVILAPTNTQITFPIRPNMLAKHLAARISTSTIHTLAHGWKLDEEARHMNHPEHAAIAFTEKEAQLIARLAQALPHACPRIQLLQEIWGHSSALETHTLETHVYRLRSKLATMQPKPCDIVTEDGAYRLVLA